ncbi:phosphotransferase [Paenarthrobacter nitroguajacolicus]|uniref:Hydroxylysine kinase n=1 Tax=Paenarthrobacter nitroguajacolicus TaxID=211146 RepID=A0A558GYP5_PAENT|nr:phosphotransferase [Paenarthrobacter nitroguajacolicus]TVU62014.1 phosphotransferase [Paenarthrobacter nitroguajacolicus]
MSSPDSPNAQDGSRLRHLIAYSPLEAGANDMDVRTDSEFFDAVASESGLLVEQTPRPDPAILDLLAGLYGLTGKLTRIPTEKDETFRLQEGNNTYLVKLSSPDEDPLIVHFQTACMEHLERASPELPVQRLVKSRRGDPEVLLPSVNGPHDQVLRVMRFMPGNLLGNHTPTGGQLRSYGSSLARLGLALQDFEHSHDDRLLMWDLKHFHRMRPLLEFVHDKDKRSVAEDVFDQFDEKVVPLLGSLTTQVIHGDFSPFNVLVDPQVPDYVTGIIDFGDAVRTPVIFDLSVAMANQLGTEPHSPWERALHVMDGFRSIRSLPIQEWEALTASASARLLLRALITQWRASQLPQRRDYLLSHSKSDWDRLASTAAAPANLRLTP